jgi:hypothetical protein
VAPRDEPRLEVELARGRSEERPHRVVGGRQQADPNAEAFPEPTCDLGQRRALPQRARAHEVEAEVPVAEREPRLAAEAAGGRERVRRLVAHAPAALLVEEPGERVEDGVEVGRDVEPEDLDVVADVHDRRDLRGPRRPCERVHEPGAAEPSAEDRVPTAPAHDRLVFHEHKVHCPGRRAVPPRGTGPEGLCV